MVISANERIWLIVNAENDVETEEQDGADEGHLGGSKVAKKRPRELVRRSAVGQKRVIAGATRYWPGFDCMTAAFVRRFPLTDWRLP